MNSSQRYTAFISYLLPVVGWFYAIFFHRKEPFVVFHTRQAIGLCLFLLFMLVAWGAIGYVLAMIPYGVIFSMALFSLVIVAFFIGLVIWIMGMANALRGKVTLLPIFGRYANSIPL